MKTLQSFFYVLLLAALIIGCQEVVVGPEEDPGTDVNIVLKGSFIQDNSKYYVLPGIVTELSAENKGSTTLKDWVWKFSYNNTTTLGQRISHIFNLDPPAQTLVTVTAYDSLNREYSASWEFNIISDFDNIKTLWQVSKSPSGDGRFDIVLAARKGAYIKAMAGTYMVVGDPVGSFVTGVAINPSDTSYNVSGNVLVPAGAGQKGTHIAVRLTLPVIEKVIMGIGKFRNNNSNDMVWDYYPGGFTSPDNQTLITAKVLSDGSFVPYYESPPASVPGLVGDNYLRFGMEEEGKLMVFTKTETAVSPFVRLRDSSGVLLAPMPASSLEDFPEWSMVEIPLNSLQNGNLLIMHYGYNIASPEIYSPNETKSKYYHQAEQILKAQIIILDIGGDPDNLSPKMPALSVRAVR